MLTYRNRKVTSRIIVHDPHVVVPDCYAYLLAQGRTKGLLGVGFHFVIESNGAVCTGRLLECVGSHTPRNNEDSVGVCLAQPFTPQQREAFAGLVHRLQVLYGMQLSIVGHSEVPRSRSPNCPCLDMGELRAFTRREIEKMEPEDTKGLSVQQALILNYLKAGHTLSTQIALVSLGIQSLSSRVAELRSRGYGITSETAKDYHGRTYFKYELAGDVAGS